MSKKRNARRRARNVLLIVSMMLVVAMASIGGTVAWLAAKTTTVTNTFTAGDITLDLKEHDYIASSNSLSETVTVTEEDDYKIVPGLNLPKDPFVTVGAKSEACWLFVKIEKENWLSAMTYAVDTAVQPNTTDDAKTWTRVPNVAEEVYYIKVNATSTATDYNILKGEQIVVPSTISKTTLNNHSGKPVLKFTAYAVQQTAITDVNEAWTQAQDTANY